MLGDPKVHDDELIEQPLPLRRLVYQPYAPQGYAPQGHAPQGYAPQGYAPQGYAPQGYAPQGYAPQGDAPQGYAPQGDARSEHFHQRPSDTEVTDKAKGGVKKMGMKLGKQVIVMFFMLVTALVMEKDVEDQGSSFSELWNVFAGANQIEVHALPLLFTNECLRLQLWPNIRRIRLELRTVGQK